MPQPRAEVFWQIPTAGTDKMTNAWQMHGAGGGGRGAGGGGRGRGGGRHAWLTEPLLLGFSTEAYFYLAGLSLLTPSISFSSPPI